MALKNDYKDYKAPSGQKFKITDNGDDTYSIKDVTDYSQEGYQEGDKVTADELNDLATQVNTNTELINREDVQAQLLDAKYGALVTPSTIDALFVEWWGLADNDHYTKTELLERWFNLLDSTKIYGVKTPNFATSQSYNGELTDDSIELGVCTPSTTTVKGTDNFCKEKAFWTVEVNYEIADDNGEIIINAVDKVNTNYSRTGVLGMVGVAQKSAYYYEENDGSYEYLKYSCIKYDGYKSMPECVALDKSHRSFMVHAKYMGGLKDGVPTSATGLAPMIYDVSHNSQITKWRTRGKRYSGMSSVDNAFREKMFRLKYAKKGNSATMGGCHSYNYDYTPAVAETDVTRVVLTTAQVANLVEGSWVSVGTASRSGSNVLPCAKIKSITTEEISGTTYGIVNLDTTTKISPTTSWHIATIPWGSGSCDEVLGVDGSPNLTNGKYPYIIQGLETQIGAYCVLADVIASEVYDSTTTYNTVTPKIVKDTTKISTSPTSDYEDGTPSVITSTNAWAYIQDINEGDMVSPKEVGGGASSSNGYQCAIYTPRSSGNFEWLVWAFLSNGGFCGLACSFVNGGLSFASWYFACGASGSGANRGEEL